jgi:hypothetical protein
MGLRETVCEDERQLNLVHVCIKVWSFVSVVRNLQFLIWGTSYKYPTETSDAGHGFYFRYSVEGAAFAVVDNTTGAP